MASDFMTFEEVLEEIQLEAEELKRMVSEEEIRAFRDGGQLKFKRDEVLLLKEQRETQPTIILPAGDESALEEPVAAADTEAAALPTIEGLDSLKSDDEPEIIVPDNADDALSDIEEAADDEVILPEDNEEITIEPPAEELEPALLDEDAEIEELEEIEEPAPLEEADEISEIEEIEQLEEPAPLEEVAEIEEIEEIEELEEPAPLEEVAEIEEIEEIEELEEPAPLEEAAEIEEIEEIEELEEPAPLEEIGEIEEIEEVEDIIELDGDDSGEEAAELPSLDAGDELPSLEDNALEEVEEVTNGAMKDLTDSAMEESVEETAPTMVIEDADDSTAPTVEAAAFLDDGDIGLKDDTVAPAADFNVGNFSDVDMATVTEDVDSATVIGDDDLIVAIEGEDAIEEIEELPGDEGDFAEPAARMPIEVEQPVHAIWNVVLIFGVLVLVYAGMIVMDLVREPAEMPSYLEALCAQILGK